MEGQGKRLLLAVALAFGVILLWNTIFPSKDDPKPAPMAGSGTPAAVVPSAIVPVTSGVCEPTSLEGAPTVEVPRVVETRTSMKFPGKVSATFSTYGGSLIGWQLADERFEKDHTKGEFLPSLPDTGAFQIGFWRGSTRCLPKLTEWQIVTSDATHVVYSYAHNGIEIEKAFTVDPDAFIVKMALKLKFMVGDKESLQQRLAITTYAFQDPTVDSKGGMQVQPRVWMSSTLRDNEIVHTPLNALKDGPNGTPAPRYEANITWTGFEHPYLLAAYAPKRYTETELVAKHTYPTDPYGLMRTDLEFQPLTVKTDAATFEREVVAYLGPKYYTQLQQADAKAGFETGFNQAIDLGWFAIIGKPLMWLLFRFQSVVGNWGIAIILLTFLVKGVTLFWTTKSMRSMKAMAALTSSPQMKALQDKYKDDKPRLQAEQMALYKQNNINPIAGCLPIVLQMPIWFALYRMLSNAGELYQQPFLPGWIDDLTNTDPYHILPIVLVVTMFLQARLTPQSAGSAGQQKFLQYGMPLMFGVMSFFFPAGLTLYIFTNTLLSAAHAIYMNKYDKKTLDLIAKLKANSAEVVANSSSAKPSAGSTKKPGEKLRNGSSAARAKPIIDVAASENASDGEAVESSATTEAARQRPRRKKKKR